MINTEPVILFEGDPSVKVARNGETVLLEIGIQHVVLTIEEAEAVARAFNGALSRAEEERKRNKSWLYRKLFT